MDGPAARFAREVAAVDAPTAVRTGQYVHVYRGQFASEEVRFHVLAPDRAGEAAVREAFEHAADQWETFGDHPNVAAVRARGEQPRPWLAVEAVDGESLETVGPDLPTSALRSVVADAAEALHEAARAGVHGVGITPEHVHVRRRNTEATGRIDWGLDRACRAAAGDRNPSPYTAPELAEGRTADTPAADVYALGAITYYAATGSPPSSPGGETTGAGPRNGGDPRPPSAFDPSLPAAFDAVVMRALSADPSDRHGTPYEFKLAVLFDAQETTSDGAATGASVHSQEATGGEENPPEQMQLSDPEETNRGLATRRAVLGAVGLTAIGGAVLTARRLDGGSEPAVGQGRTGPDGPPNATFAFEYEFGPDREEGLLTITHSGGDGIDAADLVLMSSDLDSSPVRWSDYPAYEPDGRIVAGDSIVVDLSAPFVVEVRWDSGDGFEKLDSYEVEEREQIDPQRPVPSGPPTASFALEYGDGAVTVEHEGGEGVLAGALLFRGVAFSGAPSARWSEMADLDAESWIEPGDLLRFDAAEDAVVHLLWRPADGDEIPANQWEGVLSRGGPRIATVDRRAVLAQFSGPGRPLDAAIGGVPTGRYDATNAGAGTGVAGPATGATEQWSFASADPDASALGGLGVMAPAPAVAGGVIYAGSTDGALYAVDAVDGTELWRVPAGAFSSATVRDGTLYVGGTNLLALDPSDGSPRWRSERGQRIVGPPRVRDGTVYAASSTPSGWTVRAVNAADGRWEWTTGAAEGGIRPPAVADDVVYVSGSGLRALSATSGHTRWTDETVTSPTAPVVSGGTVYVGEAAEDGGQGAVTAFDRSDGTVRWHRSTPGPVFAAVAVAGERVYAVGGTRTDGSLDGGFLTAVDAAEGTVVGTVEHDAPIVYPPTVADGIVYVADEAGQIVAFGADEGVTRWTHQVDDSLRGPPVAVDGRLFVVGERNALYALDEAAGE